MGCSCKSNTSVKKQASPMTQKSSSGTTQVVRKSSSSDRKQIVIRRPAR